MGRKSSIDSLPEKIRAQVNFLLSDGGWTIDQVVQYLKEAGHPRSRSAVGRKRRDLSVTSAKLQQSREITETLVQEIGPAATEGKHGRLLAQMLRSLVYDHLEKKIEDGETEIGAQDFYYLANTLKQLSQGVRYDQDFEEKLIQRGREQAAETAVAAVQDAGMPGDRAEEVRKQILGVKG